MRRGGDSESSGDDRNVMVIVVTVSVMTVLGTLMTVMVIEMVSDNDSGDVSKDGHHTIINQCIRNFASQLTGISHLKHRLYLTFVKFCSRRNCDKRSKLRD